MTKVQRREKFTQFDKGKSSWKRWYLNLGLKDGSGFQAELRAQISTKAEKDQIWLAISKQSLVCSAIMGGKRVEAIKTGGCNDRKEP